MHPTTKLFIEALEKLQAGNIIDHKNGICDNVVYHTCRANGSIVIGHDQSENIVGHLAKSWDKFSGYKGFPIPSGDDLPPEEYYMYNPLWEGEQLEYRLSLIQHILNNKEELDRLIIEELDRLIIEQLEGDN